MARRAIQTVKLSFTGLCTQGLEKETHQKRAATTLNHSERSSFFKKIFIVQL